MHPVLRVARRELRRMACRPIYWFCMAAAPIFCFLFFTSLMSAGLPTDLPLGLVDNDDTPTTRELARSLDAFQMTAITTRYASVTEARKAVQRGDVYGFYYIPEGTTRKAQRQAMPTVSFYTNYSYLVAGSLVYRDMRTMSELASGAAARTVLYAKGATDRQAMAWLQPIVTDTHAIGNPWLNYNVYLSNTILPGLLMLFIFMVTVFSIGEEVKRGTEREWLAQAGGSMTRALAGKLLPQTAIFLTLGLALIAVLYGYLHFPCNSGPADMCIVMFLGIAAAQGLGVFMYAMLPSLRLGLSFASLWGIISFSICGMSFPVPAKHPVLQGLAFMYPQRHYFLLYVYCALDGHSLPIAWPYVVGLLIFAALPVLLMKRLKRVILTVPYTP